MSVNNSRLQRFYELSASERLSIVKSRSGLNDEELGSLHDGQRSLPLESAEKMIENVIGTFSLPLGIATNFQINGRDYLIPMVVEEPSIVAGASHAAKLVRVGGGFQASHTESLMIGQIQLVNVPAIDSARLEIIKHKDEILSLANRQTRSLVALGGGARDIEIAFFPSSPRGPMLVIHLLVDCCDAMGANIVNSMAEAVAPLLADISGGNVYLRILSNLSDQRLARVRAVIPSAALARSGFSGEEVIEGIMHAHALAVVDPYRAATHNKGILNGIDPVLIATGNDWRAVEAGAHAYASRNGHYSPLSSWERNNDGDLEGSIEAPMAVGIIGGATKAHPGARSALRVLGVKSAGELAEIIASVGLSTNLASLIALATDGIQRGHMRLHARQVAMSAGAHSTLIDEIARRMCEEGNIKPARAEELLIELQG